MTLHGDGLNAADSRVPRRTWPEQGGAGAALSPANFPTHSPAASWYPASDAVIQSSSR